MARTKQAPAGADDSTRPDDESTGADNQMLTDTALTQPKAAPLVKARVLADGQYGKCNDVIEIAPELAATLGDVLDTTPEAVAYAESLHNQ